MDCCLSFTQLLDCTSFPSQVLLVTMRDLSKAFDGLACHVTRTDLFHPSAAPDTSGRRHLRFWHLHAYNKPQARMAGLSTKSPALNEKIARLAAQANDLWRPWPLRAWPVAAALQARMDDAYAP